MKLIPSTDNSIEPRGSIGKQSCGIVFWQKTGFLRHCNKLGLQSIVTLITKKYTPTKVETDGECYFIEFENDKNKILFLTLKNKNGTRNYFIYGEAHTAYVDEDFHLKTLDIIAFISKQIGTRFFVNDATGYLENREKAIAPFIKAANEALHQGLGLNAGHDLDLVNLEYFHQSIPNLLEVSIGHALICDSLYYGLENTIQLYKRCLK